jgi:cystathionine beta-lyase
MTKYRTVTSADFGGQLLRVHAGLENIDDLKADLAQGFAHMAAVGG